MDPFTPGGNANPPLADLQPEPAPRRRRGPVILGAAVVAVVAVVALTLALAGGGSTSKSATLVLSDAARETTGGTARIDLTTNLTVNGRTSSVSHAMGSEDYRAKRSQLSLDIGFAGTMQARVVDGNTYIAIPTLKLPGGREWLEITPADIKGAAGIQAALGPSDPSAGLQFLSSVRGDPTVVGDEKVDGATVTHYAFTLDLKDFFARLGDASTSLGGSGLKAQFGALGSMVDLSSIPAAAWIDADGRVRRFTITIQATESGESVKVVEVLEFSHFGEPVNVVAPDAADTVPFSEVPNVFKSLAGAPTA